MRKRTVRGQLAHRWVEREVVDALLVPELSRCHLQLDPPRLHGPRFALLQPAGRLLPPRGQPAVVLRHRLLVVLGEPVDRVRREIIAGN